MIAAEWTAKDVDVDVAVDVRQAENEKRWSARPFPGGAAGNRIRHFSISDLRKLLN